MGPLDQYRDCCEQDNETSDFHKMRWNFWVTGENVACQELHSFMELVSLLVGWLVS
jgi:hypothetical protein